MISNALIFIVYSTEFKDIARNISTCIRQNLISFLLNVYKYVYRQIFQFLNWSMFLVCTLLPQADR